MPPPRPRHHRNGLKNRHGTQSLKNLPTPHLKPLVLGYVREFGAVLGIADLDEGVRLEIEEVGACKARARLSPVYGPEQAYW